MILEFPLSVARDHVPLAATAANPVEAVSVAQLPAGTTATLHFGHSDPGRPINQEGQTWEPDPPHSEGLFLTNLVGAGTLILEVAFRTYQVPVPVVDVSRSRSPAPTGRFVDQLLRNFGLR